MADDRTPLDDELDPTEDTPDSEAEDTDTDETPDPSDPEVRLKEAQRTITRLSQENALFRNESAESDEDDDDEDEEDAATDSRTAKFEAESWALAERLYGQEAIDAYGSARRLLRNASTPADFVAAFEAYYDIRANKPAPVAAKGGKTRAEATRPTETGREGLGPDLQKVETNLTEARKGNSLDKFAAAAVARMGFKHS